PPAADPWSVISWRPCAFTPPFVAVRATISIIFEMSPPRTLPACIRIQPAAEFIQVYTRPPIALVIESKSWTPPRKHPASPPRPPDDRLTSRSADPVLRFAPAAL